MPELVRSSCFRMYVQGLDSEIAERLAGSMLSNFVIYSVTLVERGQANHCRVIEYFSYNNDDKIRWLEFVDECDGKIEYFKIAFWDIHLES
jgi:hypothetical protein